MALTFAQVLARDGNKNLRFYFTISGIKHVFHTQGATVPSALISATRTRLNCVRGWTLDRRELDRVARRAKGGAIRLMMVDDDVKTLAGIFAVRKARKTWISSSAGAATTGLSFKSTTGLSLSEDVYVGGETIITGAAVVGTACTRGAYGSRAAALRGGTLNGQSVYDRPPSWRGRILTMVAYFLSDDGTSSTAALSATVGVWEIDQPPKWKSDQTWELSAVDRMDTYCARGLYIGVRSTTVDKFQQDTDRTSGSTVDEIIGTDIKDPAALFGDKWSTGATIGSPNTAITANDVADVGTHCFVLEEGDPIYRVQQVRWVASLLGNFLPTLRPFFFAAAFTVESWITPVSQESVSARSGVVWPCAFLVDSANSVLLKLLTSVVGDTTNGADDVLLGLTPSNGTEADAFGWRLGAGILLADVDTSAVNTAGRSVDWWYFLAEPQTVGEVIADFCFVTDSFALTTASTGQLSFKPMSPSSASVVTLTDADRVGTVTVDYDEGAVYPHVVLRCGYRRDKSYAQAIEVNDAEISERYPTTDATLELKCKSVSVGWAGDSLLAVPQSSVVDIEAKLRRYQCDEASRGAMYLSFSTNLDHAQRDVGDLVTIGFTNIPNLEGGSVSSGLARVVSVLPRWVDGLVEFKVQMLRGFRRVSPAAILASAAGATMTLATTGPEKNGSTPGRMWATGNKVRLWGVSANTSEQATVLSVTDTTVVLTGAPVMVVQNNVDFITMDNATNADTNTTGDGYVPTTSFLFQVEDDETTFSTTIGDSRWE